MIRPKSTNMDKLVEQTPQPLLPLSPLRGFLHPLFFARLADLLDVAMIGAAAAAEDVETGRFAC